MKKEPRGRKPQGKDASDGKPRSPRSTRSTGNARGNKPGSRAGSDDAPRSAGRPGSRSRSTGDDKPRSAGRPGGRGRSDSEDSKRPYSPRGKGASSRGTGGRPGSGERSTGRGRNSAGDSRTGDRFGNRTGRNSRDENSRSPRGTRSYGRDDDNSRSPRGNRSFGRDDENSRGPRTPRSYGPGDERPRSPRGTRSYGRGGDDSRDNRRSPRGGASDARDGARTGGPRGRFEGRDDRRSDDRRSGDKRPYGGKPTRGTDGHRGGGKGTRDNFQSTGKPGKRPRRPDYDQGKMRELARQKGKTVRGPQKETRLNKYIANGGICSRREADELIANGEVTVNGKIVTEMGHKVQKGDVVKFKGKAISSEAPVYVLLNKPKDFITTTSDPHERRTVMQLVSTAAEERLFPVGRLDRNTTGLLLLTNDGELADKLTHPSNNIKKLYEVTLDKPITPEDFVKLQEGLNLEDGMAKPDDVAIVGGTDDSVLGLEIHIGRNRIVRRMFEHLGYEVIKLDRVMYAGLTKKDLSRGQWRYLSEKEVVKLKYLL